MLLHPFSCKFNLARLYLLGLFFCHFVLSAQATGLGESPTDELVVYDLTPTVQIYDVQTQKFIPFGLDKQDPFTLVGFWLDTEQYAGYALKINTKQTSYLLIDQKVCAKISPNQTQWFKVDSLAKYAPSSKIWLLFYYPDKQSQLPSCQISQALTANTKQATSKKKPTLDAQSLHTLHTELVIVYGLTLLAVFILLRGTLQKTYPVFWSIYSNFYSSFSGLTYTNLINLSAFAYITLQGALAAFVWFLNQRFLGGQITLLQLAENDNFYHLSANFFILFAAVCCLLFAKYLLILLSTLLFGIRNIANLHLVEHVRLANLFYGILAATFVLAFVLHPPFYTSLLHYTPAAIIAFHSLQALLLSVFFVQKRTFKNLYLFFYLCITEAAPVLIGIKLLLLNISN